MKRRIDKIDGLRALAVLGVIWVHVWTDFGNIPFNIGPVNINKLMAFGGNGVDLFFVISGFCMYLMYGSTIDNFTSESYLNFFKRRWLRIAPAFYSVLAVETILFLIQHIGIPVKELIYHLFFINIFLNKSSYSASFWSLATEWHFYLLFPFLFLFNRNQKYLIKRVVILMIICFIFRLILFYIHRQDIANRITIDSSGIWFRFIEFGFGIIAANYYLSEKKLPVAFLEIRGFIVAIILADQGRICMLTEFVNYFGRFAFILRACGEPLMTLGFALFIYNLISFKSILGNLIANRIFLFIGKISYSMYLWHMLIIGYLCSWIVKVLGDNILGMYIALILSFLIVIPLSWVSFKMFEEPYFKKSKQNRRPKIAGAIE